MYGRNRVNKNVTKTVKSFVFIEDITNNNKYNLILKKRDFSILGND